MRTFFSFFVNEERSLKTQVFDLRRFVFGKLF